MTRVLLRPRSTTTTTTRPCMHGSDWMWQIIQHVVHIHLAGEQTQVHGLLSYVRQGISHVVYCNLLCKRRLSNRLCAGYYVSGLWSVTVHASWLALALALVGALEVANSADEQCAGQNLTCRPSGIRRPQRAQASGHSLAHPGTEREESHAT